MTLPVRNNRGFGMLGLVGLIVLLATLTAAVSISSLRSASGSNRGVERLQVLAAAEGAAVMLASGSTGTSSTLVLGECRVTIRPDTAIADPATSTSSTATIAATLESNGRSRYSRNFRVNIDPETVSLEPLS